MCRSCVQFHYIAGETAGQGAPAPGHEKSPALLEKSAGEGEDQLVLMASRAEIWTALLAG